MASAAPAATRGRSCARSPSGCWPTSTAPHSICRTSRWTASPAISGRISTRPLRSRPDRKSTRLNSSHDQISYAVFCLKKKIPSFVSGAMAKADKGLLEGTLQAGTSAVSDKLLDLVGLDSKSASDKGKDTRDYIVAAFP